MNWREAFLRQARSENSLRNRLNDPRIEYSHRLHYLQMVTEKLAKGYQTPPRDYDHPPKVHIGFVRFLQTLKGNSGIRDTLRYGPGPVFNRFVNSLLDLAKRIEQLAPSAAGSNNPNPEYPWRDAGTGEIRVPVDYDFPGFSPRDISMIRLEALIKQLLPIQS
jgi:hypothetical protein